MTKIKRDDSEPRLSRALGFMRRLWRLVHAMESKSKRMNRELGVTGPQRLVIRIVARKPEISAGRLAELLAVHPSTLTGPLRRLEERNLLRRSADPDDARRALLSVTAAGKEVDVQRAGTVEAAVRRAMGRLDKAELVAAARVLEVISEELEREDD